MSMPPTTVVLFVRHTRVPSASGAERTPGLSCHGCRDVTRVTARLADLADMVATSPAERARATVEGVTNAADAPLIVDDDLRERKLADSPIEDFGEAVEHLWANPNAPYPGGKSHAEAQAHGVAAVDHLVGAYPNHHVVVGTHTTLMALVFSAYDPRYGRGFWTGLTTSGVYEVTFVDSEALSIARTWTPEETTREGGADRDPTER